MLHAVINRTELGSLMLNWHDGQNDPVYAVGSFYLADDAYPRKAIVLQAFRSLQALLWERRIMLRGIPVMVTRNGKQVDLRVFAGYSDRTLRRNIRELRRILRGLRCYYRADYAQEKTA